VRAAAAWALAQSVGSDPAAARGARQAILGRLVGEGDNQVRGALAEALGRLPIDSASAASETERALVEIASRTEVRRRTDKSAAGPSIIGLTLSRAKVVVVPEPSLVGALRGLEAYARGRARAGERLAAETVERLREVALGDRGASPRARTLAMLCLLPVDAADRDLVSRAMDDDEPQVRRLAVSSPSADLQVVLRGMRDKSWMVRYEALLRYGRRFQAAEGCGPILDAIGPGVDHQTLLAIDLLGAPCRPGERAVETLIDFAAGVGGSDWHRPAHALVAVVKVAPERSRWLLPKFAGAAEWQARAYAARAAGQLRDVDALKRLAADPHAVVRTAAVGQLSAVAGHQADPVYVSALESADFELVMTAAAALSGSPDREAVVPALFSALTRLTALDSDTSREARTALLERIAELAPADQAERLRSWLRDADPRVAALAARILTAWTGRPVEATPEARPPRPFVPTDADIDRLSRSAVRVTMENGRVFEMRLLMDLAPVSAAKFAALVGEGYYTGLTFHRVVAPQLVQGGSPGANEYSGASRYWRDELGPASQTRGTVGLSTRGRDTGDAQIYINLVDTPRYDNQYTIFAEVTSGMDVVDAVLEGDRMRRVELVPLKTRR
jgi:cyclophilin family peptidyl-prolyl cis-trans isomerase/HEAT repeat protein